MNKGIYVYVRWRFLSSFSSLLLLMLLLLLFLCYDFPNLSSFTCSRTDCMRTSVYRLGCQAIECQYFLFHQFSLRTNTRTGKEAIGSCVGMCVCECVCVYYLHCATLITKETRERLLICHHYLSTYVETHVGHNLFSSECVRGCVKGACIVSYVFHVMITFRYNVCHMVTHTPVATDTQCEDF